MTTKKKEIVTEQQFDFFENNFDPNPYWTSSLFNEVYLKNDIPRKYKSMWQNDEYGGFYNFYQGFISLCESKNGERFDKWNEVDTVTNWIRPVMTLLGWEDPSNPRDNYVVDNESFTILEDGKKKTYRPDLMYFDCPTHKKYVQKEKKAEDKLREARNPTTGPKMMLEAKYWDRLEEYRKGTEAKKSRNNGNRDETTRSLAPDDQCLKYMDILKHDFGILSDGKTWRLFHSELSTGTVKRSFEFDLGNLAKHALEIDQEDHYKSFLEQAKYFYYFFSKESHVQMGASVPFIHEVLEYSKKYASNIEEDLRKRFVIAMGYVCNAIKEDVEKDKGDYSLDLIRNVSESHLFNILFVKSCETRKVLPLNAPDYLKISLTEVVDTLDFMRFDPEKDMDNYLRYMKAAFGKSFDFDGYEIYDRLMRLYKVIHDGASKKDDFGFEIEGFKESVFDAEEWKFARKFKINNKAMLLALSNLMFIESSFKERKYQQIPYNYFTPRQLGSIYESFLEFRLEEAESDMVFHKGQWKKANLKSKKVQNLKLADHHLIKKGELFFTPDNKDRKMTGAYYTPDYIVKEIVENTLSGLCQKKTSDEVLEMKVCDPAMGSGHFLAGALEYLVEVYRDKLSDELMDDITETLAESGRKILDKCIFGFDINPRAVKLAKMSLWLTTAFSGAKLERLDDQLFCANSLVDDLRVKNILGKKFDGFEAIVGNPPYARIQTLHEYDKKQVEHLKDNYMSCEKGNFDIYMPFIEMALNHISDGGKVGLIIPHKVFQTDYGKGLRGKLSSTKSISEIVYFNEIKIFDNVGVYTCLLYLNKSINEEILFENVEDIVKFKTGQRESEMIMHPDHDNEWKFVSSKEQGIWNKLSEFPLCADIFKKIYVGIQSSADDAYYLEKAKETKTHFEGYSKYLDTTVKVEKVYFKKVVRGKDVHRYEEPEFNKVVLFPYDVSGKKPVVVDEKLIKKDAPKTWKYIEECRERLEGREKGKMKGEGFYRYVYPKGLVNYKEEKLMVSFLGKTPQFAYDKEGGWHHNINVYGFLKKPDVEESYYYFLGVLNSALMQFYIKAVSSTMSGGFYLYSPTFLKKFPMRRINFSSKKDVESYKKIEQLSRKIIEAKSQAKRDELERSIDDLVFDLYGFSQEEKEIVIASWGADLSDFESEKKIAS